MKNLIKQYNEEILKKQMFVGGEVFFTTYKEFEKGKIYVDEIFINRENRTQKEIDKVLQMIENLFKEKGMEVLSISLLFNNPFFAVYLNSLLNKEFKQSFANSEGLILTKEL